MELIRSNLRLDKYSIWVVLRLQLNYGMVILCPKVKVSYTGHYTVHSSPSANSAYRNELSGILGFQTLTNVCVAITGLNLVVLH